MRKKIFIVLIVLTFLTEGIISLYFLRKSREVEQDTVAVNDCLKTIEENFGHAEKYPSDLSYAVIDPDGAGGAWIMLLV